MNGSQDRIRAFHSERDALAAKGLQAESGLRFSHRYADVMDRFIRDLFVMAGSPQGSLIDGGAIAVAALAAMGDENSACARMWI